MAWDSSNPTNTEKIRLLGEVIRPNWVAIEDGESSLKPKALNLNNRTVSGPSNDPTAINNSLILYAKEDSSNIVRLFTRSKKTSSVTNVQITGPQSKATTGYTYLPGGVILAWGDSTVSNNGTVTIAGMTTLYQPVITIDDSSGTPASRAYVFNITSNTFQVKVPTGGSVKIRWHAIGV